MPTKPTDADLLDFLDEIGWQSSTLLNATAIAVRWERWLAARTPPVAPMAATHREFKAYLDERKATLAARPDGGGSATVHKDWQVITAIYAWAARPIAGVLITAGRYRGKRLPGAGILAANPMVRVMEPFVADPQVRMAATGDVTKLIEHFSATARKRQQGGQAERARRDAAMVALMFRGGCRVGELPWIDVDHLVRDTAGHIVAVSVGGRDGTKTKARKPRLVPVIDEAPKLLERYLRLRGTEPGPLFLGRAIHTHSPDRRLTTGAVCGVVERAAKRLGLSISPHDMRRGWAVESKRRGVDMASIKRSGGWRNDEIVNRYFGKEADVLAVEAFHAAADNPTPPQRLTVLRQA
jgi:integrase